VKPDCIVGRPLGVLAWTGRCAAGAGMAGYGLAALRWRRECLAASGAGVVLVAGAAVAGCRKFRVIPCKFVPEPLPTADELPYGHTAVMPVDEQDGVLPGIPRFFDTAADGNFCVVQFESVKVYLASVCRVCHSGFSTGLKEEEKEKEEERDSIRTVYFLSFAAALWARLLKSWFRPVLSACDWMRDASFCDIGDLDDFLVMGSPPLCLLQMPESLYPDNVLRRHSTRFKYSLPFKETMVKIHIVMVGETTENIVNGVMKLGADELYPLVSEKFEESSGEALRKAMPMMVFHEKINGRRLVVNPFQDDSFVRIVGLIVDIVNSRKAEDVEFWINITGGTNLMSAAAATGAMLTGARSYYVSRDLRMEDSMPGIIELPFIMNSVKSLKNKVRKGLVMELAGGERKTNEKLAGALKVGKKSISKHLQILESQEIVERKRKGKNVFNWLTDNGKIAGKLLEG